MDTEKKCHVMIDLETYGVSSNSVIRSIAAVLFNMKGEKEVLVDTGVYLESCLMAGLVIDQDTINFWRKQPRHIREQFKQIPTVDLEIMLHELQEKTLGTFTELFVWGHGSNFDIVILENAYKAIGQMPWWKYSNVRDTRTLFDIANYKYVAKGGHSAIEDAHRQIGAVCEAYSSIYPNDF